jgi:DNA-binding Lrp family transcriptional regulator
MTVTAYVLVQTTVGAAAGVTGTLRAVEGIVEANDVTGPYDVIAKASATTIDQLGRLVVNEIQTIAGVTRTVTCPVVNL